MLLQPVRQQLGAPRCRRRSPTPSTRREVATQPRRVTNPRTGTRCLWRPAASLSQGSADRSAHARQQTRTHTFRRVGALRDDSTMAVVHAAPHLGRRRGRSSSSAPRSLPCPAKDVTALRRHPRATACSTATAAAATTAATAATAAWKHELTGARHSSGDEALVTPRQHARAHAHASQRHGPARAHGSGTRDSTGCDAKCDKQPLSHDSSFA